TGKADEISNAVTQRTNEMAALLSDKHGGVLAAITEKGQQFATDIAKATDVAMTTIEQKGLTFTRSLMDNSSEMSRQISTAGETAATHVGRTLGVLQETAQQAIARSQETATSTVREMLDTHNMLRSDTTALFERLREANLMLQEVLSGSHENMSALENTLMLRVSEFVNAMHEVTSSTGDVTDRVERNITNFRDITTQVVTELGQLANQFDSHGRELAEAATMVERSNARTEATVGERRVQLDSLVATLDIRTEDLDKRLQRFTGLLDESLDAASTRAREVARVVSEASAEGSRAIADQYNRVREQGEDITRAVVEATAESSRAITDQYNRVREQGEEVTRAVLEATAESSRAITDQFDRIRENAESERRRAAEAMRSIYEQSSGDTESIFRDATERFAEAVQSMKQMAAEMQRELETTRNELRRGVFELPQETSEAAAQMRRVIVDQIEALAELNRIVARHGRNLDAVEPVALPRRREEPALQIVGGRNEPAAAPPQ